MSKILKLNRKLVNIYYSEFRMLIFEHSLAKEKKVSGEFELDESYFGAHRVQRKERSRSCWKNTCFRAFQKKREGICNGHPELLSRRINAYYSGKNSRRFNNCTDGWKAYDTLILNGYKHYRVFHHENEFARGKSHVNEIECFLSYAKRRFSKFNGLTDNKFILHLKESEARFNHRDDDFAAFIAKLFFAKK